MQNCEQKFTTALIAFWGTRWRSWLRHCATSQKVVGSIPDGVIGFIDIILLAALWPRGSTQPQIEMSTRNVSWG
jgi:hypothetical protein